MWRLFTYFAFILSFISATCFAQEKPGLDGGATSESSQSKADKKMSEYVLAILEHYKQPDPVGIPGVPIPDPLIIPPLAHSFSVGRMNFRNMNVYGLSKFRINHIQTNLAAMVVEAALNIDMLVVNGNYTLKTWVSASSGPFVVNLKDVYVKAVASLEVQRNGTLEAQEINMNIMFKNIDMKFENLPFLAKMVENFLNSLGSFIFESIKPYILGEVNSNIRNDVNKQVRNIPQTFPNSISPFDQLIQEARKKTRTLGYDPYRIGDYKNTAGVLTVALTHTWINGLSSFHRQGDIIFELKNNTMRADVSVGTQKLEGSSHWEAALMGGVLSRDGLVSFSVQYLQVQISLSQSMDTRKKPQIESLQMELGNIQIRSSGAGTADYLVELVVNVLPNLLRYQIMDALENPLKKRIQAELNMINVEKVIRENVDKLDTAQEQGLANLLN